MKNILTIVGILITSAVFSQGKIIKGKVTDTDLLPLPGVTVIVKGNVYGTTTDFNGEYSLKVNDPDPVLVFSYLGFLTAEKEVGRKDEINVVMEVDVESLDEVDLTGIRRAQRNAIKAKTESTNIIEAITPEDIGSFSDSNVADALQRVAGVQVERNDDGQSGDRVSIRGMGPQFVGVTFGGRETISAGNEGTSNFGEANLNTIPIGIISGAVISKTRDASSITTDVAGSIDFKKIGPLGHKYKKGKNYYASIEYRGTSNTELKDLELNQKISGVFGMKLSEKFGFNGSVVYTDEENRIEQFLLRSLREIDYIIDTNENGVEDLDDDFQTLSASNTINLSDRIDYKNNLSFTGAIQWKPSEKWDLLLDYTRTGIVGNSERQQFNIRIANGRDNLLSDGNLFSPGSIETSNGYLTYLNAEGALNSNVANRNRTQFFDNITTNQIIGLETKYVHSPKLALTLDLSYADLDYFQNLTQVQADYVEDNSEPAAFALDLRGELPFLNLSRDALDPEAWDLGNTALRHVNTRSNIYAVKMDAEYYLFNRGKKDKAKISSGIRVSVKDLETRGGTSSSSFFGGYTPEQEEQFNSIRQNSLTTSGFLYGRAGVDQWLSTPGDYIVGLIPELSNIGHGGVFDFSTPLDELTIRDGSEGSLIFRPSNSFGYTDRSYAGYAQIDMSSELFGLPFSLNAGVRGTYMDVDGRAFSTLNLVNPEGANSDPDELNLEGVNNGFVYHETNNKRFDLLPSLNFKLRITENFNYRFNVSKRLSKPKLNDFVPKNRITILDPTSPIFDNPDLDLPNSEYRGTIVSGNPDLKPYTAWAFNNTFEYKTENEGSFTFSAYYKSLTDYIARRRTFNARYPGEELLGFAIPENQQDLLFTINTTVNIGDAYVYGFELGFNQHFDFLPGFLSGFGLRANYNWIDSAFRNDIGSDLDNGLPGTSKNSFNTVLYYEKYGLQYRFALAYRDDYLSNLGGIGTTIANEPHYTRGTTTIGMSLKYNIFKNLALNASVSNLTGEDTRRYIANDSRLLHSYFRKNPSWKVSLRYKF